MTDPTANPFEQTPPTTGVGERTYADLARKTFEAIKKATKAIAFSRHRTDAFADYMQPAFDRLERLLEQGPVEVKVEVSTLVNGDVHVLEDDAAELNIVYPLWQDGVRLLVFSPGITLEELIKFYTILIGVEPRDASEDLLTRLWRADLAHVEWVVMTDFALSEDETAEEVDIEVEKVLTYLHRELTGNGKGPSISFARVSLEDLELKLEGLTQLRQTKTDDDAAPPEVQAEVQREVDADEDVLLAKICGIMFQVMELPSTPREIDDIGAALEQILDGLILEGRFGTIEKVIEQLEAVSYRGDLPVENRELARSLGEKMQRLMHEGQRIRAVATALNTGATRDLEGVRMYLVRLGPTATVPLLELLDSLNAPQHRRVVADVLVEVGRHGVQLFSNRLATASSNLAKELLYIIDRIDPPNKLELFSNVLKHENAVLRMEGLTAIGRTHNAQCFQIIHDVFTTHDVPQMRAHAARILAGYPADKAAPTLLSAALADQFEQRPDGEKRAIIGAIARLEHPEAERFFRDVFDAKGGLLGKRRVAERKLMAVAALATAPSIPHMQTLAEVARDAQHSKEVCEAAKQAALGMRQRLVGGGA